MRILADFHHSDLFESLQLTLADRFGHEVYRPIGMEWFDEGYWAFEKSYHGDAVAKQYLSIWDIDRDCGDHWERDDSTHPGRVHKMVTPEQARAMSWDAFIISLPEWAEHLAGFDRFRTETGGGPIIAQVGNVGGVNHIDWGLVQGGLISSTTPGVHIPVPHVIYRQEFDVTKDFVYEWPPKETKSVASFIQCFAENKDFYGEFLGYARAYPDFDWKVYGAYGSHPEDEFACGNLPNTPAVAQAMQRTRIAWHSKWWSDGYGHIVHNLFATGKPVIGYADYYADKLAGPLWLDGVTCLDLSKHSMPEVHDMLVRLRDDDEAHRTMSEASANRFREVVNFDEDAQKVRRLIEEVT